MLLRRGGGSAPPALQTKCYKKRFAFYPYFFILHLKERGLFMDNFRVHQVKKFKNHKSGYYGHHKKSPFRIIIGALICATLVFLGWSISAPVYRFIASGGNPSSTTSSPSHKNNSAKVSSQTANSSSNTQKITSSEVIKAFYLPASSVSDLTALNTTLNKAKAAGFNAVVVLLKGDDGYITYKSNVPMAITVGAVSPTAFDAAVVASKIKAAGLTPIGKIVCFIDPKAPAVVGDAAIKYAPNPQWSWQDWSYPDKRLWLNATKDIARKYCTDLATEAATLGFKNILLDGVQFPVFGTLSSMTTASDMTKEAAITKFITDTKLAVSAAGGNITICVPGTLAVGNINSLYGFPANVYSVDVNAISPTLSPSYYVNQYFSGLLVGQTTIAKPDLDPINTITLTATQAILTQKSVNGKQQLIPTIQAYTNSTIPNYKQYTNADITGEINALKQSGINSYILYNPIGVYDFEGISAGIK
jgi:hypothetical protein